MAVLSITTLAVMTSAQNFYDVNTVNLIELQFSESNWDVLLDQLVSDGNEQRLTSSVTINGVVFDSVGVRYKGNSTYNPNRVKNPLNIKLDYLIDDQLIDGFGTLKLANAFKDPSLVREVLSYEIARKYMPASQANYANVYINGSYLGLYTNDQDVDKFFMRTHFGSDENARIKGELTSSGGPPTGGVWEYSGEDSSSYFSKYALESDFGWQELIGFLDTLNNHSESVDQVLNIDRHLWFLAFSNLFVNLDGPINNPQNYYIYQDDAGRFNPIPWDLNESFGGFSSHQTLGILNITQLQQLSPFANLNSVPYPIISRILPNQSYKKMYVAHMKTLLEENVSNGLYETRAFELQSIIDADYQSDPNKFYTYTNFLNNVTSSVGTNGPPPNGIIVGITQLMDVRANYLSNLAEFQAQAPTIVSTHFLPAQVSPLSQLSITATVDLATQVYLGYRFSRRDPFQKIEMLDDGAHSDGQAGNGIFGVSGLVMTSDMEYYIYAENDEAGRFFPEHAEQETFSVKLAADVVINEFLADNETSSSDQDGEYDDWIELYNTTESEISLTGYSLSDDGSDLQQWIFPDTSIQANGFLVIWADNDPEQAGLHANFKLSASGETIYLGDAAGNPLNEVVFSPQDADYSMGRYPEGTGDFYQLQPSIGTSNSSPSKLLDDPHPEMPDGFFLSQNFPNPFNPETNIRYGLGQASNVSLHIYDIRGQLILSIESGVQPAGNHEFSWNGMTNANRPAPAGLYLTRLQSGAFTKTIKMVLIK